LESGRDVRLPFMAPRLQGELRPDGMLEVALWGAGALARVRLTPLTGPYAYGPNRVTTPTGGLFVAQGRPALLVRGAQLLGVTPARRPAAWAEPSESVTAGGLVELAWGRLIARQCGDGVLIAAGADTAEAESASAYSAPEIVAEADVHVARCDRLPQGDPILRSLVMHGVHAGLASVRRTASGAFAGLSAGLAYSAPARTYFRDGYWTTALLLRIDPAVVRAEIDLLAEGVQPDGEAPSGVISGGEPQARQWRRATVTLRVLARRPDPEALALAASGSAAFRSRAR
jgi:hypothetical protein